MMDANNVLVGRKKKGIVDGTDNIGVSGRLGACSLGSVSRPAGLQTLDSLRTKQPSFNAVGPWGWANLPKTHRHMEPLQSHQPIPIGSSTCITENADYFDNRIPSGFWTPRPLKLP